MEITFRLLASLENEMEKSPYIKKKRAVIEKQKKMAQNILLAIIGICFMTLANYKFALLLIFAGIIALIVILINSMLQEDILQLSLSSPPPRKKKADEKILFNEKGFKVYFLKSEIKNYFRYKDIQNLLFSFTNASLTKPPKPSFISWEMLDKSAKSLKKYHFFFDTEENYPEDDFLDLFHFLYESKIPFSEVSESGKRMRLLRLPAPIQTEKKPKKEPKIAKKYQKLIDEIGKKEE